jgi:formate dehydrogenase major subunit
VLFKRAQHEARRATLIAAPPIQASGGLDRRSFLHRSGLAAGSLAALGTLSLGSVRKAEAGPPPPPGATLATRKNVCTHCSVGCTVIAEVANGVWRAGTARSIAARTAARARPCETMC